MPAGQRSWEERRAHVLREFRALAGPAARGVNDALLWRVLDAATARGATVAGWHGLRYLRTVLAWALSRKLIDRDPTADLPLKDIRKRMKERPRDRVLSPDELGRLWRALEADGGGVYSAILRVAALTAQRINEVAGMRWADLDLARGEWRQPTNKSDRPHLVPLSAPAAGGRRGAAAPAGRALRLHHDGRGRLDRRTSNVYRASPGTTRQQLAGWSPHDLRRTAATMLAEAKVAPVAIEQLLNHAEGAGKGGGRGIYNRASYALEKRRPSTCWPTRSGRWQAARGRRSSRCARRKPGDPRRPAAGMGAPDRRNGRGQARNVESHDADPPQSYHVPPRGARRDRRGGPRRFARPRDGRDLRRPPPRPGRAGCRRCSPT